MTDLNAMALFVRVVETGSMSAAARLLTLPKSTISRRIALLEHELGATLLHRSTRSLSLTDTGRIYYERAHLIVLEAQQAELEIRSRHSRIVGTVRISATIGFGQKVLAPIMCELLRAHLELKIDLRLSDDRLNVIEDGLDLAIRMGTLDDADLLSRRITTITRVLCASPDYLEANGIPETPYDLIRHNFIVTASNLNRLRFTDQTEITVPWRLSAGNVLLACDAAIGGHGIALLPHFLADEHLKTGKLIQLLEAFPLPRTEATALYPRDRIASLATKAVIEALVQALANTAL